jgi:hypothetical protein
LGRGHLHKLGKVERHKIQLWTVGITESVTSADLDELLVRTALVESEEFRFDLSTSARPIRYDLVIDEA